MQLFRKQYDIKTEQKQALKLANKQVKKVEKLLRKYTGKFKRAIDTHKKLVYSAVVTGLEIELTQALQDQKTIQHYYKRMLGGV